MKKITITEDEYRNIMFYVNYAQTELLLKWSNDKESKETQTASENLYYHCKALKEKLNERFLK